ncbi:hypothetical protein CBM2617_U10117 [Cupriavidus taiwanensis]|nr:hypothetical protein CBM2617_U10117 [Cupriavidus taiwanensis]
MRNGTSAARARTVAFPQRPVFHDERVRRQRIQAPQTCQGRVFQQLVQTVCCWGFVDRRRRPRRLQQPLHRVVERVPGCSARVCMQPGQRLALRARAEASLLAGMRDRIDRGVDRAAVLVRARGQRRVLAHRRGPMPQNHRLEHRIAAIRPHCFAHHACERAGEAILQLRIRRFATRQRDAGLFDHECERRRWTGIPRSRTSIVEVRQAIAARNGAQRRIEQRVWWQRGLVHVGAYRTNQASSLGNRGRVYKGVTGDLRQGIRYNTRSARFGIGTHTGLPRCSAFIRPS